MNYKAGDTVVCIDAKKILYPTGLKAGQEYVVAFTNGTTCTAVVGVRATPMQIGRHLICAECGEPNPECLAHFNPWRFIKLDPLMKLEEQREEAHA